MIVYNDENKENTSTAVDYDEEGRKLLALVHLESNADDACFGSSSRGKSCWRKLNAKSTLVYKDPRTGGTVHVGNATAAGSLDLLDGMGNCRKMVYCQGGNKFEQRPFRDDPAFEYFHFPIAQWKRDVGYENCNDPVCVAQHFQPLFDFLDNELAAGNAVLIHCLAGAHRAGTTGIASLMHLTGMNAKQATKTAQSLRPVINPIGDFPKLLQLLEEGLELREQGEKQ
eukprot:CAMPEP_0113623166 /NCGR_PEP_ID=MMETSP0017_2-20120614/11909_1 /TAXON_ID=2856 /ORGANISM="Cylindrotheca closterium" /LENGTH=226 /DNA_ID=CAMNT_0000533091 /DNA_START=29 /DNA_END=709 /DNA_ORIENTATION=- /assembly_acc=CAM_ASM_000147